MNNRWIALAIIALSFIQLTLNWFAIIPAFGGLAGEFKLTPAQVGGILSAFIAGYGLFHLPGGMLAERFGLRAMLLTGIGVETVGATLSGLSHSYGMLIASRVLCGIGGSIYIGCAIGLTTAWFRDRYLATANGLVTGVAFSVGAALGLFGWGVLTGVVGWRAALLVGATVGAATLLIMAVVYPRPPQAVGEADAGGRHSLASFLRVLGAGPLWIMSFAFIGGYGAYFAATAWLPAFAASRFHASPATAEGLGAILLLSGIVGSVVGGWLADKVIGLHRTFLIACILEAIGLAAVPFLSLSTLWIAAALIGASTIAAFVTWIGLPGVMPERIRVEDVPSAAGLMLTIVAVGGVLAPTLHGSLMAAGGPFWAWLTLAGATLILSLLSLIQPSESVAAPTGGNRPTMS